MENCLSSRQAGTELRRLMISELGEMGVSILNKQCSDLKITLDGIEKAHIVPLSQAITRATKPILGYKEGTAIGKKVQKIKTLMDLSEIEGGPNDLYASSRKASCLILLGHICTEAGEFENALKYFDNALLLSKNRAIKPKEAEALIGMGNVYCETCEWEKSISYYQHGMERLENIDSTQLKAQAYRGLGYVLWKKGEFQKALENTNKALEYSLEVHDNRIYGIAMLDKGSIYSTVGEVEKARKFLMQSINILSKVNDFYNIARAYNNLGDSYLQKEDWENAIKYLEKCREKSQLIQHGVMEAWSMFNMAEALIAKGNSEQSVKYCKAAIETLERLNDPMGLGSAHIVLGKAYGSLQEWEHSSEAFQKSREVLEKYSSRYYLGMLYLEWGTMLAKKGDSEAGKATLSEAMKHFETMESKDFVARVNKELSMIK